MIVELFVDGLRTRLFRNHAAFHVEANACSTYIGLIIRCFLRSDNLSSIIKATHPLDQDSRWLFGFLKHVKLRCATTEKIPPGVELVRFQRFELVELVGIVLLKAAENM